MAIPTVDIQSLSLSAIVDLWVLDCSMIGGEVFYFHAGTNQLGTPVVWQGQAYLPLPIQMEGISKSTDGTQARPTLRISALDGVVTGILATLDDLTSARVTRIRTYAKYLDSCNFPDGNPYANPNASFPEEKFSIEQRLEGADGLLEFQMVSRLDMQGRRLPARPIQASLCGWLRDYRGAECGYSGDLPTCSGTLEDCKTHFGETSDLPFGAFPGTSRIR